MCNPALIGLGVAVVSAVSSHEQGRKAASQQEDTNNAQAEALRTNTPPQGAQAPDEQARRNSQRATGGVPTAAATMLTGAGGVANDLLNLGKNTLLGQ